jgi:tetratricopeptide (TPR) repeat protein
MKRFRWLLILISPLLLLKAASPQRPPAAKPAAVKVEQTTITLPTYLAGDPEPNPMFFFGRNSQGAEGRIYPYPFYDTLTGRKIDKTYKIVYLENEYLRIGILPEIGGRLFEGIDKTNGYHFIYRQHVIKPALIGLIGAWISGGIEWNIPHHHRASTFIPVQHSIEENPDGSRTVWVGELEIRHRMRWAVGYTLHPGKAYLEAKIRIVNRTPVVQTMLCFANVAVHANNDYQVIFPPGTQYATYHGKREFTEWPLATARFAGADFTSGVDVSWYKNNVNSNSFFAWNYEDDFFAGYDHGRKAGIMSIADHQIVPGKKLWTWGTGPRGQSWEKILTDQDGPYIELMTGGYSDNQPDYSWLQPFESRSFSMNWYPFRAIGGVKKANLEAAVNLEASDGKIKLGFCTTSVCESASITLTGGGRTLLRENATVSPDRPYLKQVELPAGLDPSNLHAAISVGGRELVAYTPGKSTRAPAPPPVTAPGSPESIKTAEELYLAGLRIEQFHDPNLDPDPYWEEALRRDPGDVRVNTAFGIHLLKEARYGAAEKLLRKAVERLTANYTSPKDGEPIYYLALALKSQGRNDEAFDLLSKSTWSQAWRSAGYFTLAEIAASRGETAHAMDFVDRSIRADAGNIRALHLKAALFRHSGRLAEVVELLSTAAAKIDPLDVRTLAERWLADKSESSLKLLAAAFAEHPATAQETAAEYANAGMWKDGSEILAQAVAAAPDRNRIHPLIYYYSGYFAEQLGLKDAAMAHYRAAARIAPDYVFPFQSEAIDVLKHAIRSSPADGRAPHYLGNLLYDWQPEEALRYWEAAAAIEPSSALIHRNIAVALMHRKTSADLRRAIAEMESAVGCDRKYALHFAELEELYDQAKQPLEKRLKLFEQNQTVVSSRDDSMNRGIALMVAAGKYEDAISILSKRHFAVAEGANINVAEQWANAHILKGRKMLAEKRYREALADFQAALVVPANLPSENISLSGRSSEVAWWSAAALAANGDQEGAAGQWKSGSSPAVTQGRRPQANASKLDAGAYYLALCLLKTGGEQRAGEILLDLIQTGLEQARDAQPRRAAQGHWVAGLGYLGTRELEKAKAEFAQALELNPVLPGVREELALLK